MTSREQWRAATACFETHRGEPCYAVTTDQGAAFAVRWQLSRSCCRMNRVIQVETPSVVSSISAISGRLWYWLRSVRLVSYCPIRLTLRPYCLCRPIRTECVVCGPAGWCGCVVPAAACHALFSSRITSQVSAILA